MVGLFTNLVYMYGSMHDPSMTYADAGCGLLATITHSDIYLTRMSEDDSINTHARMLDDIARVEINLMHSKSGLWFKN